MASTDKTTSALYDLLHRRYRQLKYLKIPEKRLVDVRDRPTRTDELLEEVIYGLDMMIDLLSMDIMLRLGMPVTGVTAPAPTPTTTIRVVKEKVALERVAPPTMQVITISKPMRLVGIKKYSVDFTADTRVELDDRTKAVLFSVFDDNVYFDLKPIDPNASLLLPANVLYRYDRAEEYKNIYFRASTGTARVYISQWTF